MKRFKKLLTGKPTRHSPATAFVSKLKICLKHAAEFQISGYYESALAESNRALQLDPTNAVAYHTRSLAKYGLADEIGALADWKKSWLLRL